jgi:hypothetical protein
MSENARDYMCPDVMGRDLSPQEALQMADTFMTMEFQIHRHIEEGWSTYQRVNEAVMAFLEDERRRSIVPNHPSLWEEA